MILLANLLSTAFMTGLIWFVQVVHYPLFAHVGGDGFPGYATAHQRLTTLVVGPAMLVEAATAVMLAAAPPAGVPAWTCWLGVAMVAAIWISTALLQVPEHGRLARSLDLGAVRRLVAGNWLRTWLWTGRSLLVAWMGATAMAGAAGG